MNMKKRVFCAIFSGIILMLFFGCGGGGGGDSGAGSGTLSIDITDAMSMLPDGTTEVKCHDRSSIRPQEGRRMGRV
jgi:hypothetical protein